MLDKDSVLNAHSISGNPSRGSTETAKSPPHDHEVSLSYDRSRFVLERWRKALDEIEQPLTTRRDMSAVLNVLMPGTVLNRLGFDLLVAFNCGLTAYISCHDTPVIARILIAFGLSDHSVHGISPSNVNPSINPSSGWELLCYFIYPFGVEGNMLSNLPNRRKGIIV
jgi:hypothetical protein